MGLLESQSIKMPDGTTFAGQRVSPEAGIIIGGPVTSTADWQHLQSAFGATHLLNVCTEKDAGGTGVNPANLSQQQVPDSGSSPPGSWFTACAAFIAAAKAAGGIVYIMSQRGVSRAPMAYLAHQVINNNTLVADAIAKIAGNVQTAVHIGSNMAVPFGNGIGHVAAVAQLKSTSGKK